MTIPTMFSAAILMILCPSASADSIATDYPAYSKLVHGLDDGDVDWVVDDAHHVTIVLKNEAKLIATSKSVPFRQLVRALSKKAHFVSALAILTKLTKGDESVFCIKGTPSTWTIRFGAMDVLVSRSQSKPVETQYRYRRSAMEFESQSWKKVTGRKWHLMRKKLVKRNVQKKIRLGRRKRGIIGAIRNSDVRWVVVGFGTLRPELSGQSARVAMVSRVSLEELIDATRDSNKFIAAHVLLCRQFGQNRQYSVAVSDGYFVNHQGLRLHVRYDFEKLRWNAVYPKSKEQQSKLSKQWGAATVTLHPSR